MSFYVYKVCFCDDDRDDDDDDDDDIAIVHGLKTMVFQTQVYFIRVAHGIAWYCVVLHVTGLH